MTLRSVTTRGFSPVANEARVTTMGYSLNGQQAQPDVGPPSRGGPPIWWYGRDCDGPDERKRKRLLLEQQKRADYKTQQAKGPPTSVEINAKPKPYVTEKKRTKAWITTRDRFRRKKRGQS